MNINPATMRNVYQANMVQNGRQGGGKEQELMKYASAASPENTDKISISSQANYQRDVNKVVHSVMKDMEQTSNADRVQQIKEQIQNNSYFVSSGQVADAILSRICGE